MTTDTDQTFHLLPIDSVDPDPHQDRDTFDDSELLALSHSIAELGQITPILVRPTGDGRYMIVGGERRWRALQLPPCQTILTVKALVDTAMTDHAAAAAQSAENLGRVDLDPIQEAKAFAKLRDRGMSNEQIALACGVVKFRVQWRLDLLTLIPEVQSALTSGVIPPACALELRRLGTDHQMAALKAWLANPTMGHLAFKRKTIEWAEQALSTHVEGLFALDTDQWAVEAQALKAKSYGAPALRAMIVKLTAALEAADPSNGLLEKARSMV